MKTPVTLRVSIDSSWDADTRLQVYTDEGGGTVDTTRPLLPDPKAVFPGAAKSKGYGRQPYGRGRHGNHKPARSRNGGYGRRVYGRTPHGRSEPYLAVTVQVPATFGLWKFAVEAVDQYGNVQAGGLAEIQRVVSGTEPPPIKDLALSNYDAGSDQVTLKFALNTE